MRFIVFNGSPRGNLGVTRVLINAFVGGLTGVASRLHPVEVYTLQQTGREDVLAEAFASADVALIAFPLMSGTVPASVKRLFEALAPLKGRPKLPGIILLDHSAFPNAGQFAFVEKYVSKVAERLGCQFFGALHRPEVGESLDGPPTIDRDTQGLLFDLGTQFGRNGHLDSRTLQTLLGPHRAGILGQIRDQISARFPLRNLAWARLLLRHGTFEQRRRRPGS